MSWLQIVLIVLLAVIAGLLVGGLVSYLIARLLRKPFLRKAQTVAVVEEPLPDTAPDPVAEAVNSRRIAIEPWAGKVVSSVGRVLKKPFLKQDEMVTMVAVAEEPMLSLAPDLVIEVENNHRIAAEPWADKLLPFQTSVWDANQEDIHTLPADLQEELTQAYVDMRLANSIVWLSAELGRRSPKLDESYTKLCANITTRLDKVVPLLKRSGN